VSIIGNPLSIGGGVPKITKAAWDALTMAEKQAYGFVAVTRTNSGLIRGDLLYGADYDYMLPYSDFAAIVAEGRAEKYSGGTDWDGITLNNAVSANANGSLRFTDSDVGWVTVQPADNMPLTAYMVVRKYESQSGYRGLLSSWYAASQGSIINFSTAPNAMSLRYSIHTSDWDTGIYAGDWHVLAFTADENRHIRWYIDGVLVGSQTSNNFSKTLVITASTTANAESAKCDVFYASVVSEMESEAVIQGNCAYLADYYIPKVNYYNHDGSVLLHTQVVARGENATWIVGEDTWATTPNGTTDANAKNNILAPRNLYYTGVFMLSASDPAKIAADSMAESFTDGDTAWGGLTVNTSNVQKNTDGSVRFTTSDWAVYDLGAADVECTMYIVAKQYQVSSATGSFLGAYYASNTGCAPNIFVAGNTTTPQTSVYYYDTPISGVDSTNPNMYAIRLSLTGEATARFFCNGSFIRSSPLTRIGQTVGFTAIPPFGNSLPVDVLFAGVVLEAESDATIIANMQNLMARYMPKVNYYSHDGSTLMHTENVARGYDAVWVFGDDTWAIVPNGETSATAKDNITSERNLYYTGTVLLTSSDLTEIAAEAKAESFVSGSSVWGGLSLVGTPTVWFDGAVRFVGDTQSAFYDLVAANSSVTSYMVFMENTSGTHRLIANWYANSNGNVPQILTVSGQIVCAVYGTNDYYTNVSSTGAYHCIAIAMDGSTKAIRYFVDGVYQTQLTASNIGRYVDFTATTHASSGLYGGSTNVMYMAVVLEAETDADIIANMQSIMDHYGIV
jgi:hypothetical protein